MNSLHNEQHDDEGLTTSTLYCSGFPLDVSYREVRNLFQYFDGFIYARLVNGGKVPIAFATFDSHENALAAKDRIHGSYFQEDSSINLRLEFAKSEKRNQNMLRKRVLSFPERNPHMIKKSMKTASPSIMTVMLFGLSEETTKDEIQSIVKESDGYLRLRWSPSKRKAGGTPVAFVDFDNEEHGLKAIRELNGQELTTVPKGILAKVAEKQGFPPRHGPMGMLAFTPPQIPFNMGRRYPPADFFLENPYPDMVNPNGYRNSGYGHKRGFEIPYNHDSYQY